MISNKDLRSWAASQRGQYRRGWLSKTGIRRLESIPSWTWGLKYKSTEEHVQLAEHLAKQYEGQLPNRKWLIDNGYVALYRCLDQHPEFFKHIEQVSKRGKSAKEWVPVAEQLVREHSGTLPDQDWLYAHGYSGLAKKMCLEPELFNGIKRRNAIRAHVEQAEKLAAKYGKLPNPGWLTSNGYEALYHALRKYPKRFSHIKKISPRVHKSLAEWIKIAEQSADKSGGYLLSPCTALSAMISHYPESFAHIPRRILKTTKQWVKIARALIAKQGGIPPNRWLKENGYKSLLTARHRHPSAFEKFWPRMRGK